MAKEITEFAQKIGVDFNDINILRLAFTHRSYVNENRAIAPEHNERLEFLGDAVLELVVTDHLFRTYPNKAEGELTAVRSALVNTSSISEAATSLGMNDYLLLSKGESQDTGRARSFILANAFEAVIGAIYLDSGYERAREFIAQNILHKTEKIVKEKLWIDNKSYFQEKAQEETGITPHYDKLSESGPDHQKIFTMGVYIGDELVAQADGISKQDAEQKAARQGLEAKGWI